MLKDDYHDEIHGDENEHRHHLYIVLKIVHGKHFNVVHFFSRHNKRFQLILYI